MGSFLNVCIYRMPRSESILKPRSHCVHCGKMIKWYQNIPLFSYLFLRGKCAACRKPISFRYFVVELLTASLFVVFYSKFGLSFDLVIFLIMASGMILATFIDFDHQLIPDTVSLGGLGLGLLTSLIYPQFFSVGDMGIIGRKAAFLSSVLGAVVGGLSIYIMGFLGKLAFKKEAMGFGDVKYMAMVGSFLGWKMVLFVFFLAPIFGASVGIVQKIKYKEDVIPYGPYLSLATLVAVLWGEDVLVRLMLM